MNAAQVPPPPTPEPLNESADPIGAATSPATRSGPIGIDWSWWIALASLAVVVVFGAILVFGDGGQGPTVSIVSVAEIVDDPDALTGERVVTSGRVQELLTDRALSIGSDLAGSDLLVLIESGAFVGGYSLGVSSVPLPVGEAYEPGDVAQFQGTLREFDRDALSDELGLVLNDELFDTWADRPALVVDRLDVTTMGQLLVASPPPVASPSQD